VALVTCVVLLAGCTSSAPGAMALTAPKTGSGIGQPSPFLGANLSSVACGATLRCVASAVSFDPNPTSATLTTSTNGGLVWRHATGDLPSGAEFLSTGCAASVCMVAGRSLYGALAYASAKPAAPWKPTAVIEKGSVTQAVTCAGLRWCMVIAADSSHVFAVSSLSAGAAWTAEGSLPAGTATIQDISCSSTLHCLATGTTSTGAPEVAMTPDGGETWTTSTLPSTPGIVGVLGAACRSGTTCIAIVTTSLSGASTILESSDDGATFGALLDPSTAPVSQPLAVSCVATTCVIVGRSTSGSGAALELATPGTTRSLSLAYVPTALLSVSCPTTTRCVAASTASLVVLSPSVPKARQQQSR